MINKKIGIDIDGVLADWSLAYSKLIRKYFGIANGYPLVKSDDERIKSWAWAGWYPGYTKEMDKYLWNTVIGKEEKSFWFHIDIMPDAKNIDLLNLSQNNTIYFITNRPENKNIGKTTSIQYETTQWLHSHFEVESSVIITADKGPVVDALNLDYFIDDKYENCRDVSDISPTTKVYMPKRSYNQQFENKNITTIDTILDFPPFKRE